jgi:hypothetical protein
MNDTKQKLDVLCETGRQLVEQIEIGGLVDIAGNRFEQNLYFIAFKALIENIDSIEVDPEVQAFNELVERRSQIGA